MPDSTPTAPYKTDSPPCPRCRAIGRDARTQPTADAIVCFGCGTTWQRGPVGQMIAAGAR